MKFKGWERTEEATGERPLTSKHTSELVIWRIPVPNLNELPQTSISLLGSHEKTANIAYATCTKNNVL
jgi:hypothetical protein